MLQRGCTHGTQDEGHRRQGSNAGESVRGNRSEPSAPITSSAARVTSISQLHQNGFGEGTSASEGEGAGNSMGTVVRPAVAMGAMPQRVIQMFHQCRTLQQGGR